MFLKLFHDAGWVAWPLGLFSILALGIILERLFTLSRLRSIEDKAFLVLQTALEKPDGVVPSDPTVAAAPVTQIITSISPLRGATEDALQTAADIALGIQRLRLRRYLTPLATIGSTAPFVGLFGTVLGVMAAFHSLAQAGAEQMAAGISEALSATAVGLLVAIPSVIAYNFLLGRVQHELLNIQGHVARLTPLLHAPTRERQRV